MKLFLPNNHVKSIFEIEPKRLKALGIDGIITDLDNTLVPWNVKEATPAVYKWFESMQAADINVTIISNNNEERVRFFSKPLCAPYISNARKPLLSAFKKAASNMELPKDKVAVIGDQLLTDILGGNLAGFYTILVVPIVESDAKVTTFNRRIERMIINKMRKKGMVTWEK